MAEQRITLTQHWLGMEPFVLLTARVGDEGPDDLRMGVEFGGGPEDVDEARSMLLLALPSLGATVEEIEAVLAEVRALAQPAPPAPARRRHDPGALTEEPDLYETQDGAQ